MSRHPDDGARVPVDEGVVAEFLGPVGRARHGGGIQHAAQDGEREMATIGANITQQAQIGVERTIRRRLVGPPRWCSRLARRTFLDGGDVELGEAEAAQHVHGCNH